MKEIRVLVVDDHIVFRQGLVKLLQLEKDIKVVGEASTGAEAVKLAREARPDVILMDLEMPEGSGVEATREIKEANPGVEIIVLTGYEDSKHLFDAIKAGANGYISKQEAVDKVVEAIRVVSKGESLLSKDASRKILEKLTSLSQQQERLRELAAGELTRREIDILRLLAQGKTNAQIARDLFVTEKTVKNHVYNIYRKLKVGNRPSAVLKAIELGLVDAGQ